jgi:hypothetical protein
MAHIQDEAMPIHPEETATFRWRLRHGFIERGLALAALLALIALSYRLMHAPIHGVHGAADCARLYAEARTHEQMISADNVSYQDPARPGVDMRCGMVRAGVVGRVGR